MKCVLICAALAQLVEHRIRNARVGGSTPLGGLFPLNNGGLLFQRTRLIQQSFDHLLMRILPTPLRN